MFIKQRVQRNIGMVIIAAFALVAIFSHSTFAADSDNVIKISPLRSDISVKAGTSTKVEITVTNTTSSILSLSPIENDFTSADEKGTPAIILDANTYAPTHSLKRFLSPLPNVTIPVGQSKTIDVVVTVPSGTQAGGYYGAIRFTPSSPDSGGQVNLSASVASLILLTVPGPTVEALNLTDFDIQQKGKSGTYFNTSDNLTAYIRFENKGNIQEGPFGVISVKNGNKIAYETEFNTSTPRDVVLPDGARRWDVPLKKLGNFGYFTLTATLSYGSNNQTVEVTKSFWVVPMSYIIAAGITIIVLILIIVSIILLIRRGRRRRHHGYRRR